MKITKRQLKNLIMESLLSEGTSHVVGGAHYAQVGDYEVYVKDVIDTLKELGAQPVPVPIGSFAPVNITRPENVAKYIQVDSLAQIQQGGHAVHFVLRASEREREVLCTCSQLTLCSM